MRTQKLLCAMMLAVGAVACGTPHSLEEWPPDHTVLSVTSKLQPWDGVDVDAVINSWNALNTPIVLYHDDFSSDPDIVIFNTGICEDCPLGYAEASHADGFIRRVMISINIPGFDEHFPSLDNYKDRIVCHEIGHALGLGHRNDDWNSCMNNCQEHIEDPVWNRWCYNDPSFKTPSEIDKAELNTIYHSEI